MQLFALRTYKLGGKLFEPEKVNGPSYHYYYYYSEACLYFVKAFLCQTATAAAIGGYIKVGGKLLLKWITTSTYYNYFLEQPQIHPKPLLIYSDTNLNSRRFWKYK